ncbi:hypothetical protein TorRG33x02_247900 [Trema orientale]|uniref:Uncharacterized protein n=1 Tax=Trema orientale TaxID=63057 RepID=A0A2P5DL61_TREOI|nr:hypothetical protein TorRG33x02_247900 [Trema orientale]
MEDLYFRPPANLLSITEINKTLEKMKYGRSTSLEQSGLKILPASRLKILPAWMLLSPIQRASTPPLTNILVVLSRIHDTLL